jgi:hypothetical protein
MFSLFYLFAELLLDRRTKHWKLRNCERLDGFKVAEFRFILLPLQSNAINVNVNAINVNDPEKENCFVWNIRHRIFNSDKIKKKFP